MSDLRTKTVKAIGWNTSASFLIQAFGIFTSVVLTRILDPADFGLISMVAVFTGFAHILQNFGFTGALIQRKEIVEGHKSSVFWINFAMGLALTITFFFLAPFLARFYDDPRLISVTRVLSLIFFISSLNLVQDSLVRRRIDFKIISRIRLTKSVSGGIVAIVLAIKGFGYWALIAQSLFSAVVNLSLYWYISKWRPRFIFNVERVKELLSFGVNITFVNIINYLGNKLDILLMGKIMGAEALGFYGRSKKFQGLPFEAIKAQIAAVLFPTLSRLQDDKPKQIDIYLKLTALLSLIIFPIMMGLFSTAEEFVIVVLTNKWAPIIPLVQIFSIAFLFSAIGFPQITFKANGKAKELLNVSLVLRLLRIILVIIGIFKGTILMVTIAVSTSMIIEQLTMNYFAAKIMGIPIGKILKSVLPILFASYIMAGIVMGADYLFMDDVKNMPRLILKVLIGIAVYVGFLVIWKPNPLPFIFEHYWPPKMKTIQNFFK